MYRGDEIPIQASLHFVGNRILGSELSASQIDFSGGYDDNEN